MRTRLAWLSLCLLLGACAREDVPGRTPIRVGQEPDVAAALGLDASPDASGAADGGPDVPDGVVDRPDEGTIGRPTARQTWVLIEADTWAEGVRAALRPAQPPGSLDPLLSARQVLALLPGAVPVVRWAGADSPGDALLQALREDPGGPIIVLYDLVARAARAPSEPLVAAAVTDVSWLAAELLEGSAAVEVGGQPVLIVSASELERPALEAMAARLEAIGRPVALFAYPSGEGAEPPYEVPGGPGVVLVGVIAAAPAGFGARRLPDGPLRAARAEAARAGLIWVPRAAPPRNERVFAPDAGVVESPEEGAALVRSLVLARRAVDPAHLIVWVEGIGRWRDDGQLDIVRGLEAAEPVEITEGHLYQPYGEGRAEAVRGALLETAGRPPSDLATDPPLVELVHDRFVWVRRLEQAGDRVRLHARGEGPFEALLDDRPFILPPRARLLYERSAVGLYVDLYFEGGGHLRPTPPGIGRTEVRLDDWADQRVEGVVLGRVPNRIESQGSVAAIRIRWPGDTPDAGAP